MIFIYCVCKMYAGDACVKVCMQRREGRQFVEPASSFVFYVGSRVRTRVVRFVHQALFPLSRLASPP